ncbi:cyclin-dependent kinase inhibitor 6-like [Syzygium oleosum]|uniref:cyclin-dependent kinase inhibitor 6-like n=1 Tax=Syzygium oleosum TaxID=219896 RepID=UPI0024BB4A8B|nr:cyclin-dependent kinase inhibitor 6-like [Syzygium oleosum]
MVRKCRGSAAVAVMDAAGAGARTRAARAGLAAAAAPVPAVVAKADANAPAPKRRRVGARRGAAAEAAAAEEELRPSCGSPHCDRPLVRGGSAAAAGEEDRCLSGPSSCEFVSVSCCSSNGSSEVEEEVIDFVDLEEDSDGADASTYRRRRRARRERTPSSEVGGAESDDMGSASKPTSEANSRWRPKMPTQAELDDFFAMAEKSEALENFKEKYNFDFVKEEPLKGRYEWSRIEESKPPEGRSD